MKKLTREEVIMRCRNVHGDKYDYSNLIYHGAKHKITVTCSKHGDFKTILDKHTNGSICPKCDVDRMKIEYKKSLDEFISDAISVHGDKYDYSLVDYVNNKTKVKIICPEHGEFEQRSGSHIEGYGCSQCKESIGERNIRLFLENNNITFISQHRFNDCKNVKPLPFDFYLPEFNMCIEFNGLQHYEPNHFFVTSDGFDALKSRDLIKSNYCDENGIKLIVIRYDENISTKLNELIMNFPNN